MIGQKENPTKSQSLAPPPHVFDWKLFKNVANVDAIKNEATAKSHFMKHAHMNTRLRNDYFRALLKIPTYFDEELYVDFLQNEYNVKMKKGEINNDSLYAFYANKGKKTYPLKDVYFKTYYKIPAEFDEELYKKIYQYSAKKEEFNNELKKHANIYQFYNEKSIEFPIDHDYLKLYYNTPDEFDYDLYKQVYNLNVVEIPKHANLKLENSEIYKKLHIYNHYKNNANFLNNETYFKQHYHIPDSFNEEIYIRQYPELKSKISQNDTNKYNYFRQLRVLLNNNPLDNKYNMAQAQAIAQAQAQAIAEAQAQAIAQAQVQANANAQTSAQAQSQSQANAQANAKSQAIAKAQAQSNAQAIAEAQAQSIIKRDNELYQFYNKYFNKIISCEDDYVKEYNRCTDSYRNESENKMTPQDFYILTKLINFELTNIIVINFLEQKITMADIAKIYDAKPKLSCPKYSQFQKDYKIVNLSKENLLKDSDQRFYIKALSFIKENFEEHIPRKDIEIREMVEEYKTFPVVKTRQITSSPALAPALALAHAPTSDLQRKLLESKLDITKIINDKTMPPKIKEQLIKSMTSTSSKTSSSTNSSTILNTIPIITTEEYTEYEQQLVMQEKITFKKPLPRMEYLTPINETNIVEIWYVINKYINIYKNHLAKEYLEKKMIMHQNKADKFSPHKLFYYITDNKPYHVDNVRQCLVNMPSIKTIEFLIETPNKHVHEFRHINIKTYVSSSNPLIELPKPTNENEFYMTSSTTIIDSFSNININY